MDLIILLFYMKLITLTFSGKQVWTFKENAGQTLHSTLQYKNKQWKTAKQYW